MINIFISRPTWIAEEFREGLNVFLAFLGTHDLKPRTIGSTDYPTESPLVEVIRLMDECEGAIILGYPQIYLIKGNIKGTEKNDFLLPTEWNHIESTLAYIKEMPLLIIHHKGISGGIFDRGAISKFLYEKDLSKPTWFLSQDIIGALKKWQSSIKEPKSNKITIPNLVSKPMSSQTARAKAIRTPPLPERLNKDVESALLFLFNAEDKLDRTIPSIKDKFKCNDQVAQYYIDVILAEKMIWREGTFSVSGHYYSLTPKGREYVMTNKLLSS